MYAKKFNLKMFFVLVLFGIAASLLILPYLHSLTGDLLVQAREQMGLSETVFNLFIIVQSSIMYSLAAFAGILLYRKAGYRMPLVEKYIGGEDVEIHWCSWIAASVGSGLTVAVLVIAGDFLFLKFGSPLSLFNSELPVWWKGLLGAYSAAVGEEYLFRLLIMTVVTLILYKMLHLKQSIAVWIAIVISALLFGLMHLPATAALVDLTPLILIRAMLLNGIGGVIFGFLYWKRGLEAAIVAHFITDIIVHGLLQALI